jgi:hypothetical protein
VHQAISRPLCASREGRHLSLTREQFTELNERALSMCPEGPSIQTDGDFEWVSCRGCKHWRIVDYHYFCCADQKPDSAPALRPGMGQQLFSEGPNSACRFSPPSQDSGSK